MLNLRQCVPMFLVPLLLFAFNSVSFAVDSEQVLYAFTAGASGAIPSSSLIMDASGNLYGTTSEGGILSDCEEFSGCGVVYELTRTGSGWQETAIYSFQSQFDGEDPSGNLVFDSSGNLYGTTVYGGNNPAPNCRMGCGTVFELSPNGDGTWSKTTIHSFQSHGDGESPYGLTIDAAGNLYGLTQYGGTGTRGVVYKLLPPTQKGEPWTEQIIYDFADFETAPNPGLTFDRQGNLYGTYYQQYICYVGCGAVFQLKPAQGTWTETDLFDFSGGGNGGNPMAGVIVDNYGNVYGTAVEGGNNWGMAFELKPGQSP